MESSDYLATYSDMVRGEIDTRRENMRATPQYSGRSAAVASAQFRGQLTTGRDGYQRQRSHRPAPNELRTPNNLMPSDRQNSNPNAFMKNEEVQQLLQ